MARAQVEREAFTAVESGGVEAVVAEAWYAWRAEVDFAARFVAKGLGHIDLLRERIDGRIGW